MGAGCGRGGRDDAAVVFGAFLRRAEDGVGFAYLDEAGGGVGVVGMEVWVVRFGEGVELSFGGVVSKWEDWGILDETGGMAGSWRW